MQLILIAEPGTEDYMLFFADYPKMCVEVSRTILAGTTQALIHQCCLS